MSIVRQTSLGGNPNVVLQNVACDSSVYIGAWVRMDGTGTAFNAIASSSATANIIGICESKSSATLCNIRVGGVSLALYAGLDPTKDYFLSPSVAGGMQTTPPSASGQVMIKLGQPFSATQFLPLKGPLVIRS
jgi:hypothetical protein